jgi:hypothetical protein
MLEAHIKIEKELAVEGFRRALKFKAVKDISYFYGLRLMIVWIVISLANALAGEEHLSGYHGLFLIAVWIAFSVHVYYKWHRDLGDTEGWEFYAQLDEFGVTTTADGENRNEWNFYSSYIEHEDYLQINDTDGGITFLPKTPELTELVEFTKRKISEKA